MELTDVIAQDPQRILIMGLPGSGKSTLAANLASHFRLHWIDLENSISVLKKLPDAHKQNVNVLKIPDSGSFPIAAESMQKLFKDGKIHACNQHGKHDCALCKAKGEVAFTTLDFSTLDNSKDIVVLDTASQLSCSLLAFLMKSKAVDAKPERDDWGSLRKYTEFFRSQFQAATFNLIVITHTTEAAMEDGKLKLVPEFGSASMGAGFGKAFNDVVYCDVKNKKHCAFSSSTATMNVATKSRSDFAIEALPVPSLLPLFGIKQ